MKHALLLAALDRRLADPRPLTVVDTHAGAGAYDLTGDPARRSGEAEAGVRRLMQAGDLPAPLARLRDEVSAVNRGARLSLYPGSPMLVLRRLRAGDRWRGWELRAEDQSALARLVQRVAPRGVQAEARLGDGFAAAATARPHGFVLIDPPFEQGSDYGRAIEAAAQSLARGSAAAVWTPVKDLETFDRFLGGLEAAVVGAGGALLTAQARLRPLDNPLRMNGCALGLAGDAALVRGLQADAELICRWICSTLGEAGARAVVERAG